MVATRAAVAIGLLGAVGASGQAPAIADEGYRLPWTAGQTYRVDQGWGGSTSHNNDQMHYSYDFALPEGTPVRAVKAGTVSAARGNVPASSCGGYDNRNTVNYVTLNHPDGTATLYLHLSGVARSSGSVSQGEIIGWSGKTGWTNTGSGCYAHLHFQRQAQGIWITNSRPVYFDEYPGQQLVAGRSYTSQNGGAPPSGGCSPGADQIALFNDINYAGACVIKGVGSYSDPGAFAPVGNDAVSSIKVGSNVRATLYQHSGFGGTAESFTGNDADLRDNAIGNDSASSLRVESHSTSGGCSPGADQIALFNDINYAGACVIKGVGSYSDPGAFAPVGNDAVSSIKVGSNVRATLYQHSGFGGTAESFTGNDADLRDNAIGNDSASSLRVESHSTSGGCSPGADQIALFNDINYAGACVIKGVGSYSDPGAFAPVGNDAVSSIKVGSNVRATLYQHSGFGGTAESFTGNDADLRDNAIGNDSASSLRVESHSTSGGCSPGADQIALFNDINYAGACVIKGVGSYSDPGAFAPVGNDAVSSIKVGSNVRATLYQHSGFGGTAESFTGNDADLRDNAIGNDSASSLRVERR